ncbi:MAG: bifunctional diguanylate cyclase/phosphodiesterase [Candidatus Thiodiazotropha sp.]
MVTRRNTHYGAVMMLDLDHFKSLNDTQGHDVGDSLLVEVAHRLISAIRSQDTVSRLGGDEFVVLLEDLGRSDSEAAGRAESIAEKIRGELAKPYLLLNEIEYFCTVSVGVTVFQGKEHSPELLLKQADVALYEAKDAGRDSVRYYSPVMQAVIDTRIATEIAMRSAMQHARFELYYQPQVDHLGMLVGAEALIRWKDESGALVMPDAFIPLAEETGFIVAIGHWVLTTACQQIKQWECDSRFADLYLSVNVSARQLHQKDFVQQVIDVIQDTGANPRRLKLELTERALLENIKNISKRMEDLIALGVTFSLDDFGTGYASLSNLKLLPLSQVKIDRSFVQDVTVDPSDEAIVRAILAMNNTLGLPVVAEGVENQRQLDFLRENGCAVYQGFYFSRPVPIHDWESTIEQMSCNGLIASAAPD